MPLVSTSLNQNEARKALCHDRWVELNMEGLRLFFKIDHDIQHSRWK